MAIASRCASRSAVRTRTQAFHSAQGIQRIVVAVLVINVRQAMERVRSALYHSVELPARRVSKFRRKVIFQKREFRHRIVRHGHQRTSDALVVVIHAFNREVVVARTLPTNRRARSHTDAALRRHTGAQQRKVQHTAARAPVDEAQSRRSRFSSKVVCNCAVVVSNVAATPETSTEVTAPLTSSVIC